MFKVITGLGTAWRTQKGIGFTKQEKPILTAGMELRGVGLD